MIARITGKLVECEITEVVVDVGGVGYAVTIPMSTYDKLPRIGETVTLLTHHHVREDAMVLFGFATATERQLFRLLQTVSGVGPKVAIGILSGVAVDVFCQLIAAGDIKGLSKLNGVGKRTAERLVVELKDKVATIAPAAVAGVAGSATGAASAKGLASRDAQDAVAALTTLGFKPDQAQKTVGQLCTDLPAAEQNVQNLIRRALQALNG